VVVDQEIILIGCTKIRAHCVLGAYCIQNEKQNDFRRQHAWLQNSPQFSNYLWCCSWDHFKCSDTYSCCFCNAAS